MCGGQCSTRKNAFITELESSAHTESKRMINHNNPQLSRMDLANHCAAFPGLSLLNTRAVCCSVSSVQNVYLLHCDWYLKASLSSSAVDSIEVWENWRKTIRVRGFRLCYSISMAFYYFILIFYLLFYLLFIIEPPHLLISYIYIYIYIYIHWRWSYDRNM
jgi:hypothetical protein